jgi:8-oxo-dGTP diphosphatase
VSTRVGVGVVVRRPDGWVLVGRRLAEVGAPLAIPGGKLDPGESVEECAVRELEEETGIVVDAARARTFAAVHVDGWVVPGVVVEVGDGVEPDTREPHKFGAFAWMDPAEVQGAGADVFPATVALLAQLPLALPG